MWLLWSKAFYRHKNDTLSLQLWLLWSKVFTDRRKRQYSYDCGSYMNQGERNYNNWDEHESITLKQHKWIAEFDFILLCVSLAPFQIDNCLKWTCSNHVVDCYNFLVWTSPFQILNGVSYFFNPCLFLIVFEFVFVLEILKIFIAIDCWCLYLLLREIMFFYWWVQLIHAGTHIYLYLRSLFEYFV